MLHFAECVSQKILRLLNEFVNANYSLANEWLDIILVLYTTCSPWRERNRLEEMVGINFDDYNSTRF